MILKDITNCKNTQLHMNKNREGEMTSIYVMARNKDGIITNDVKIRVTKNKIIISMER